MDMEDAVPLEDKERGRAEAAALLKAREPHRAATIVRVNSPKSTLGREDVGRTR